MFVGPRDGDQAIREGDGEVFKRTGGVWNDLGFSLGSGLAASASLYRSAAYAYAVGAWTVMPFDTVEYDTEDCMTLGAAPQYTAPTDGTYLVTGMLYAPSEESSRFGVAVLVDGVPVKEVINTT